MFLTNARLPEGSFADVEIAGGLDCGAACARRRPSE